MMARKYVDLSDAPWTMHEFFAGSGLVGYGLKGMFAPIWANDISVQKASVDGKVVVKAELTFMVG